MGVQAYSSSLGVIRVCWIIFVVFWLLGAFSTKRTIYRESSAERARYWLVLVIGYFLVIKSSSLPSPLDWCLPVRERPCICPLGKSDTRKKLERRDHTERRT